MTGNVLAEDMSNCCLRFENRFVAAIGVEDLVVVATDDAAMARRATAPRK